MTLEHTPLTLLYDGACYLCHLEIEILKEHNHYQRLQFVDISRADFDATLWNVSYSDLMAIIHARKPDGSYIKGVDVFIHAYQAIGLGWVTKPVQLPVLRPIFNWLYRYFARYRQPLSGLCAPLIQFIIRQRSKKALRNLQNAKACSNGMCSEICTTQRRES